jgi:hypothetical protein
MASTQDSDIHDPAVLPDALPVLEDDGAARRLAGVRLPTARGGCP